MNTRIKDHSFRNLIQAKRTKEEIDVQSVVTPSIKKVSSVLLESSSARHVTNMVILPACATKTIICEVEKPQGTSVTSREYLYARRFNMQLVK